MFLFPPQLLDLSCAGRECSSAETEDASVQGRFVMESLTASTPRTRETAVNFVIVEIPAELNF